MYIKLYNCPSNCPLKFIGDFPLNSVRIRPLEYHLLKTYSHFAFNHVAVFSFPTDMQLEQPMLARRQPQKRKIIKIYLQGSTALWLCRATDDGLKCNYRLSRVEVKLCPKGSFGVFQASLGCCCFTDTSRLNRMPLSKIMSQLQGWTASFGVR